MTWDPRTSHYMATLGRRAAIPGHWLGDYRPPAGMPRELADAFWRAYNRASHAAQGFMNRSARRALAGHAERAECRGLCCYSKRGMPEVFHAAPLP